MKFDSQTDDRIIIFDTTLRDGEQAPGATLNVEEKIAIARQLTRLGVDVIEAGFAFASPGDFEAVKRVCLAPKMVPSSVVWRGQFLPISKLLLRLYNQPSTPAFTHLFLPPIFTWSISSKRPDRRS
jgi:hypothetical protein